MGSITDYFENKVIGLLFGQVAYTVPATVYVGLWNATLTDTSTGATAGEVSGGAYARVAVTNDSLNFDTPSGGATANTNAVIFPTATAAWGPVTDVAILDAATNGNMLAYAALNTPISVSQFDTVIIQPGHLDISVA